VAGRASVRWVFALAGLALAIEGAAACDKVIGIQSLNEDRGSASDAGIGGASDAGACSEAAERCAACVPCGEIVDVNLDFSAPASPKLTLVGSTDGMSRSNVPGGVECPQSSGPERVYAVHVAQEGFLTARLLREATDFDSVLYGRKACCKETDTTTQCADSRKGADDHSYHGGEVISFRVAKGEDWYLFVDGSDGAAGSYTLELDLARGSACMDEGSVPITIEPGSPMLLSGNTMSSGSDGENRCFMNHPTGAGDLGEIVYELRAPASVSAFDLTLHGNFNAVLYARSDCIDSNSGSASELVCADDNSSIGSEFIKDLQNPGSPLYVFVDTDPVPANSYDYTLIITPK
jgi:hypothetical protein